MKTKTKIIVMSSLAIAAGVFYWNKSIKLSDGTEIKPIKKSIGGALIGAAFGAFAIVLYEIAKNK